ICPPLWVVLLPATAAAATAPMTATAAAFTRCHGPGFRNGHVAAAVFGAVEFLDGICGFLIGGHLDKTEAFASSGVAIGNDLRGLNAPCLSKDFLKRFVCCVERKITNVKLLTHVPPWRRGGQHEHHARGRYRDLDPKTYITLTRVSQASSPIYLPANRS